MTEGQSIKAFDRICEVQSDKATVEISSRYDGKVRLNLTFLAQNTHEQFFPDPNFQILKLCHAKNAIAKVGAPLMVIEVADDVAEAPGAHAGGDSHGAAASTAAAAPEVATQMMNADGSILTTPAVRRLARENHVDLSKINGSGKDGRIMKDDVRVLASAFQNSWALFELGNCRCIDCSVLSFDRLCPGTRCYRTVQQRQVDFRRHCPTKFQLHVPRRDRIHAPSTCYVKFSSSHKRLHPHHDQDDDSASPCPTFWLL